MPDFRPKQINRTQQRRDFFVHEFDKCLIFLSTGSKLAEGFVHEYEEGTMKVYTQGLSSSALVPGLDVLIYVYNSVKGECKFRGVVRKASFSNVEIENVSMVSAVQKRENTRVNKQLKYRIANYLQNGEKQKFSKPLDINVLNISAQGLYFNCEQRFEVGFRFPLVFKEAKRPVYLTVEIIRREDFAQSYNYGCIFVDISEKDMDEIFRFVLKEQIAQRRKNMYF